jgi:hypothetical protein
MVGFYKVRNVDNEYSPIIAVTDNIFNRNICTVYSPNSVTKELHRSILLDYEKIQDTEQAKKMWIDQYNSFEDDWSNDIDNIVNKSLKVNRHEYFKKLIQMDHRKLVNMIMQDSSLFDTVCLKLDSEDDDNELKHSKN